MKENTWTCPKVQRGTAPFWGIAWKFFWGNSVVARERNKTGCRLTRQPSHLVLFLRVWLYRHTHSQKHFPCTKHWHVKSSWHVNTLWSSFLYTTFHFTYCQSSENNLVYCMFFTVVTMVTAEAGVRFSACFDAMTSPRFKMAVSKMLSFLSAQEEFNNKLPFIWKQQLQNGLTLAPGHCPPHPTPPQKVAPVLTLYMACEY